jgi:hypothetical protein
MIKEQVLIQKGMLSEARAKIKELESRTDVLQTTLLIKINPSTEPEELDVEAIYEAAYMLRETVLKIQELRKKEKAISEAIGG